MLKKIHVKSQARIELINLDNAIGHCIDESGIRDGMCHLWVPHTTAAITINENADPAVVRDILYKTSKMVPCSDEYRHGEGNSDAHIKSSLFGPSLSLIITDGVLMLGTWQSIYFCEFDGPRNRMLFVKLTED
jgi:secondary thiamine-phosphate synthase enzyme